MNPSRTIARFAFALLTCSSLSAAASCGDDHSPNAPICSSGSPWRDYSSATLRYQQDAESWEMSGSMVVGEGNDFQLSMLLTEQSKKFEAEFMMIGGTALLMRGDKIEARYAYDYMDGIAVPIQLPATILAIALPKGPQQLLSRKEISIVEKKRRIDTATISRGDHFGAPWKASGYARRIGPSTIEFDITVVYRPTDWMGNAKDGPDKKTRTRGTFTFETKQPFPDSKSVVGWRIPGADGAQSSPPNTTTSAQAANPVFPSFATVGEVRKKIADVEAEKLRQKTSESPK